MCATASTAAEGGWVSGLTQHSAEREQRGREQGVLAGKKSVAAKGAKAA